MEKLKYQYDIGNYWNVIKIADMLLIETKNENYYSILMFKAYAYCNLLEENKAVEIFDLIIRTFPNKIEPRIRLALTLIQIGKYIKARKVLEAALLVEPNNLDIINNLMFVEEDLHNFERVIELANEAITIDELEPSVWLVRASASEKVGDYTRAISDGLKAIELSRDDEIFLQMAHNNLGYTYTKMGDVVKAEFYLRKAIEIDDTDPFQFNNLGFVLAKKGQLEEGLRYINHSLELDSENSYAYKNRAKVFLMAGKPELARKDLIKAKKLDYEIEYDNEVNILLNDLDRAQDK